MNVQPSFVFKENPENVHTHSPNKFSRITNDKNSFDLFLSLTQLVRLQSFL